jgi:hypothetical protein
MYVQTIWKEDVLMATRSVKVQVVKLLPLAAIS